jgi:hypothetical protein
MKGYPPGCYDTASGTKSEIDNQEIPADLARVWRHVTDTPGEIKALAKFKIYKRFTATFQKLLDFCLPKL